MFSIPPVVSDKVFAQTLRYYNTSGSSFSITREALICPFYHSLTTTSVYPLVKSCRIARIRMYQPFREGVGTAGQVISLQWLPPASAVGDSGGLDNRQIVANATSAVPAMIDQRYSPRDVRGWFRDIEQYAANVFPRIVFQGGPECVIDITYHFILADNSNLAAVTVASAVTAQRVICNTLHVNLEVEGRTGSAGTP